MHVAYSPVGYIYNASQYCLECIADMFDPGIGPDERVCGCTECCLDRAASDAGINRMDEGSYDSSVFPKSIPYHNDLHAECGMDEFSDPPSWSCNDRCERCHDVIDGESHLDGPDTCPGESYDGPDPLSPVASGDYTGGVR